MPYNAFQDRWMCTESTYLQLAWMCLLSPGFISAPISGSCKLWREWLCPLPWSRSSVNSVRTTAKFYYRFFLTQDWVSGFCSHLNMLHGPHSKFICENCCLLDVCKWSCWQVTWVRWCVRMWLVPMVVLVAVMEKQRVTLSHLEMKWQESPCQMLGNTLILNFSVLGLWEMNFLSELMSLWYSV